MLANRLPTDYQPTTNGLPTDQTANHGLPHNWYNGINYYVRKWHRAECNDKQLLFDARWVS